MDSFRGEIKQQKVVSGSGDGCHWYPIEQDGFVIKAAVSIGENFVGVNCGGTDPKWDNHEVEWELTVLSSGRDIAYDSRTMNVATLRSLGSLGTFYSPSERDNLTANHEVVFNIRVFNPNNPPEEEGQGEEETSGTQSRIISSTTDSRVTSAPLHGFYFSAHWCPPCRGFTPVLAEFYDEVNKNQKNLEIVFVSSDKDQFSFDNYFSEMPWLALNFGNPQIQQIKSAHKVSGIPYLVIYKGNTLISTDARSQVTSSTSDPMALINKWLS